MLEQLCTMRRLSNGSFLDLMLMTILIICCDLRTILLQMVLYCRMSIVITAFLKNNHCAVNMKKQESVTVPAFEIIFSIVYCKYFIFL